MITLNTNDLVRHLARNQADQAGGTGFADAVGDAAVPDPAAGERVRTDANLFRIDAQSHMVPPPVLEFMMTRGHPPPGL